jgi:NAD+ kinase
MSVSRIRLLVLARDESPRVQSALRDLEPFLRARGGVELVGIVTTDDGTCEIPEADLALVLGGDGAILRACRQLASGQIPLLGINLGRLGFLADLSPDELRDRMDAIERREFRVVHHLMFQCELHRSDGTVKRTLGLNETAVMTGESLAMIDIELAIDDEPVTTYSADGLIISTPVGSTAHNLSAGGPILRQDLDAFVITPICPHTLTNRPLVEGADVTFTLRVPEAPKGVMLVVDGQIKEPISPDDRVTVRKADVTFQLARVPGHSYYGTLHRKLGWGGQPRYGMQ